MKYLIWLIAVSLLLGWLPVQAQSPIIDPNVELRSTESFTAISVSSAVDLVFTQSANAAVAVSASEAQHVANITTEVRNGVLYIGYKSSNRLGPNWGPRYLRAYVAAPVLYRITASGACDVRIDGELKTDNIDINLSGSSDFKGVLKAGNVHLSGSGSSDFSVAGQCTNLRVNVSGASDVKAFDLRADYVDLKASGASDVQITAEKEMKVVASGASKVLYKGGAVIKKIASSRASNIKETN
jgi:hypothetical protein